MIDDEARGVFGYRMLALSPHGKQQVDDLLRSFHAKLIDVVEGDRAPAESLCFMGLQYFQPAAAAESRDSVDVNYANL